LVLATVFHRAIAGDAHFPPSESGFSALEKVVE
jgi:hypothetical protein